MEREPGDISPEPQPKPDDGEIETVSTRGFSFINKLTDEAITQIRRFQVMKPKNYKAFGDFAAQRYHSRKNFLKDKYKNSRISRDVWADRLYKTLEDIYIVG